MGFLEMDLPVEVRRLFAVLQTQSRATPFSVIEGILREDLGEAAGPLVAGMVQRPASVASVGQVHQAVLPRGERVAVKVRHPGIEEAMRSDLSGAAAATAIARLLLPGVGASASEFVDEAKQRFLEECDYQLEADRQRLFGRIFEGHPDVVVPRVFDAWCGPRVLTTSWEGGRDFDAFIAVATQAERDQAGRALFEAYVGTLYRRGVFHADPHPGNYRFREDGRVVLFDYGCVRVFRAEEVAAFIGLVDAVRSGDEDGMRASLRGLGAEPGASAKAFARVRMLLEGFFALVLTPGAHRVDSSVVVNLRQIVSDKMAIARMRVPRKLLFLLRIRFGLYSVLANLGAVCDWSSIEAGWAEEARGRWRVQMPHEAAKSPGE
jgi:predicted unusual protein kinase regulating ubiquinone biosynthesis (AarF/ABC1/UbiB family)